MVYTFRDFKTPDEIYNSTCVVLMTGRYAFFKDKISEDLRELSMNKDIIEATKEALSKSSESEFGEVRSEEDLTNSVDFNTFLENVDNANMFGKWFCKVDLVGLSNNQVEKFKQYIAKPSKNGVLIVTSSDFKKYRPFLKDKAFVTGLNSHIFNLNWAYGPLLRDWIVDMFKKRGLQIEKFQAEAFIQRANQNYDDYPVYMDEIADGFKKLHPEADLRSKTYKVRTDEFTDLIADIENYTIEQFFEELVVKTPNITNLGRLKLGKMLASLEKVYEPQNLVYRLLDMTNELIDFRVMINTGIIPIKVKFIFSDTIKRLPENSKYCEYKEWTFRNKAALASKTTLQDLVYLRMILSRAFVGKSKERKELFEQALYEATTRRALASQLLNTAIGLGTLDRFKAFESDIDALDRIKLH